MSLSNETAKRVAGVNWAAMIQEDFPLDEASDANLSAWFNMTPWEWAAFCVQIRESGTAATPAWGSANVRLVSDFLGMGRLLIPVPGSADTVKVISGAASNIAITALCTLDDEGAIMRIPARGLGRCALQVSNNSSTAGLTGDIMILGWSGSLPPVPSDLLAHAMGQQ